MKKLLVICGTTATGKTSLALKLAKKFNGELISADSRQVYKYMNVITGKDIPSKAKWVISDIKFAKANMGYWKVGKCVRIWGYDLINPDSNFSVAAFINISNKVIRDITKRGKLPILVGGTGLYINGVIKGIQTADIPVDKKLRKQLENKSIDELYTNLFKINPLKAESLNESDRKNPRRLVRAIEIVRSGKMSKIKNHRLKNDCYWVGLKLKNKKDLHEKIDSRVDKRVGSKLDIEIDFLKGKGYLKFAPQKTIGYREWIEFLDNKITKKEAIEKWKHAEHMYAKKQLTWFKKQNNINWHDPSGGDLLHKVEENVKTWHNQK